MEKWRVKSKAIHIAQFGNTNIHHATTDSVINNEKLNFKSYDINKDIKELVKTYPLAVTIS